MHQQFKKQFFMGCGLLAIGSLFIVGCGKPEGAATQPKGNVDVVFLQGDGTTPWGKMYEKQMAASVQKHAADFKFSEQDAAGDEKKQLSQIDDAIAKKPRVLLVSPVSEKVIDALKKAHDAGIFVFLLDRYTKDHGADTYVGLNNVVVGADMGIFYGREMHLKGPVLIVDGPGKSPLDADRIKGMNMELKAFKVTDVATIKTDGTQAGAKAAISTYLKSKKPVDAVFAVNDEIALGAADAAKDTNTPIKHIFGVGAYSHRIIDAIKAGTVFATFSNPPAGPTALDFIPDLVSGTKPPKASNLTSNEIRKDTVDAYLKDNPTLSD